LAQGERWRSTGRLRLVEELQRDFRTFKAAVHKDQALSDKIHSHGSSTSFGEAWSPFGYRFPLLKQVCGCLASEFLGAATVESDFSRFNSEFDEFRTSLNELPVEEYFNTSTSRRCLRFIIELLQPQCTVVRFGRFHIEVVQFAGPNHKYPYLVVAAEPYRPK
jgi:hypothetical protein